MRGPSVSDGGVGPKSAPHRGRCLVAVRAILPASSTTGALCGLVLAPARRASGRSLPGHRPSGLSPAYSPATMRAWTCGRQPSCSASCLRSSWASWCGGGVVGDPDGRCASLSTAARSRRQAEAVPLRGSRYAALVHLRAAQPPETSRVTPNLAAIAHAVGVPLPITAYRPSWWPNLWERRPAREWLTVGWRVQHTNFRQAQPTLTFAREERGP